VVHFVEEVLDVRAPQHLWLVEVFAPITFEGAEALGPQSDTGV
jgi:hypothetical protein